MVILTEFVVEIKSVLAVEISKHFTVEVMGHLGEVEEDLGSVLFVSLINFDSHLFQSMCSAINKFRHFLGGSK